MDQVGHAGGRRGRARALAPHGLQQAPLSMRRRLSPGQGGALRCTAPRSLRRCRPPACAAAGSESLRAPAPPGPPATPRPSARACQEWNEILFNGVYYEPLQKGAPGEIDPDKSYTFKYPRPAK
jgi:hypothetical protein